MEPLIKVSGLAKSYEGFTLEGVSFAVEPGFVVGLIGQNGAGKTTILKSILGLVRPDSGTVSLFGKNVFCDRADAASNVSGHIGNSSLDSIKQRIGVVFDTCAFLDIMRVRDVAKLGNSVYALWDGLLFSRLCKDFGLDFKKSVKSLSRGMGMKLSLAFALAHHPDLLILDEATAGLDPMARDEVLDILREFMEDENHGILLATHITTDLEKIADVIVCIDAGRVIFTLERDAICDAAAIAHCRTSDLESIAADPECRGTFKVIRRGMSTDVLVPDRVAFAKAFPDISLERASVEDYMTLTLKGEPL